MKQNLAIILSFVFLALVGGWFHESVRSVAASSLGYEKEYSRGWAQLFFVNEKMQDSLKAIRASYTGNVKNGYRDTQEWKRLNEIDTKEHAIIGLAGRIFTIAICFTGLLILFFRREQRKLKFGFMDWIGVFLTLFILKDVLMALQYELAMPCDHARIELYLGLPVLGTERIIGGLGILISAFAVFYILPKNKIIPFVICGFIGGIIGVVIWVRWFAPTVFS